MQRENACTRKSGEIGDHGGCSCTKSGTRQMYVSQQLQCSARCAPRSRQVSRIRAAAAEWKSRSRAVAAVRGSMRDRGSGDVVGGELDAILMSNGTETSDAQRQSGDEVRHGREDVVTKELVAHGPGGNEDEEERFSEEERAAEEGRDLAGKRKLEEEETREGGSQTTRSREAHEALNRHRSHLSVRIFLSDCVDIEWTCAKWQSKEGS